MKLIKTNTNNYFLDQEFRDAIIKIQAELETSIPNDKNIFFAKNCTIPRLVTDYLQTGIKRVIKPEKTDYCVINKIIINDFPASYDETNNCITEQDTSINVYSTNICSAEDVLTLEQLLWFIESGLNIKYIDQFSVNNSLHNGFVIDADNYTTLKELVDSPHTDNHILANAIVKASPVEQNAEWLAYIYFRKGTLLTDSTVNQILRNRFGTSFINVVTNYNNVLHYVSNPEVRKKVVQNCKKEFYLTRKNILNSIGAGEVIDLVDFQLKDKLDEKL